MVERFHLFFFLSYLTEDWTAEENFQLQEEEEFVFLFFLFFLRGFIQSRRRLEVARTGTQKIE